MKTLTLKIVLPTLFVLLLGMLLLGAVLSVQMERTLERQMDKNADTAASLLAAAALPEASRADWKALAELALRVTRDGDVAHADFFDADGHSLTAGMLPAPAPGRLHMARHALKDGAGKTLAVLEVGMRRDAAVQVQRSAIAGILGVIGMALAAVLACIVWVVRRAVAPAKAMRTVLAELSQGNLRVLANTGNRDEIGEMAHSLNLAVGALNQTLLKVGAHALSVHEAAGDITAAVGSHAATSNKMAATVVEITAAMEELSATSTLIAEHAKTVVDIANRTWENSKKGAEAMLVVLSKIDDIRAENQNSLSEIVALGGKSKEISKVMVIINAVADQTKLIAFNAALEASSAGEAGRRFGVVAAEIRRLADSVTDSTGEIEARINEIQDSISRLVITSEKGAHGIVDGIHATTSTAQRLDELVNAASQTTGAAQQISLSTQQQKSASSQVLLALREIVDASAENAQSTTRIAQVSHDMRQMSSRLSVLVQRFRLSGDNEGK